MSLHVEAAEGFIHGDHADVFAGLHDAGEHECFAVADGGGDGGGVDEEFESEDASVAGDVGDELLGDDATEGLRDHDSNLTALVDGEHVEDSVEGSGGVAGVQGGEDEVSGLRCGEGEGGGLDIAHFTDYDDVGVFPEGASQCFGE